MERIELRMIEERFRTFVKLYESDDSFVQENLILKEEHTLRVSILSEKIAKSLKCPPREIDFAMAVAVFHDIGRFPQFSRYRTFRDSSTVNHAEMGIRIIQETDLGDGINDEDKAVIITSIRNHNRKEIQADLSPREVLHARIIRDADKLDIIPLMCKYYETRKHSIKPGIELSYPDTPGFSESIVSAIINSEQISNSDRRNLNDIKLTQLAWLLDLNFDFSRKYALEHQFVEKLLSFLPDNPRVKGAAEQVKRALAATVS